jgi:hypothetical protein
MYLCTWQDILTNPDIHLRSGSSKFKTYEDATIYLVMRSKEIACHVRSHDLRHHACSPTFPAQRSGCSRHAAVIQGQPWSPSFYAYGCTFTFITLCAHKRPRSGYRPLYRQDRGVTINGVFWNGHNPPRKRSWDVRANAVKNDTIVFHRGRRRAVHKVASMSEDTWYGTWCQTERRLASKWVSRWRGFYSGDIHLCGHPCRQLDADGSFLRWLFPTGSGARKRTKTPGQLSLSL